MSALQGKVAWITGGGSGIGQAGAIALAQAGATVVVSGRRTDALADTARQVEAAGGTCTRIAADVADKDGVQRAAQAILTAHGRIDILVASAGMNVPKRYLRHLDAGDWDRVVRANLDGVAYCTLAVLPAMRRQGGGLIIHVGSWLGRWPAYLGGAAYNSTKMAVVAFSHQVNIEEGMHGVRSCVLFPGEVSTPILATRPVPPAAEETARMLQPEDLGRTIRFVAEAPPHVCFNEIVVTPTWNRFFHGGDDLKLTPPRD